MRYVVGFAIAQLAVISLYAQTSGYMYSPSNDGSAVSFSIRNFGIKSEGSFKGMKGTIVWGAGNVSADSFDVSIDASTVNTDNEMRDEHLRKESFFDVVKYPWIRFVSTSLTPVDKDGHYKVTGRLTIKAVTKEISFPFLATPVGDDYIFKGSFEIRRKDFGVGGTSTLGDEVTVSLTVLARRQSG
jgi:polyisoprenoid-binding protein YceI